MPLAKSIFLIFTIFTLLACESNSRYSQKHDSVPTRLPTEFELKEPTPKVVAPSRGGNKNYQVFGKPYSVMKTAEGYKATGTASWYGKKFHGHLTSNGEVYDMYAFSAAHKSLPLPTYLQVTNLANNKSVIVRANDRGPFHQDRLIDLSYSAAYKLGMLSKGTAKVRIEAITHSNLAKFTKPTYSNDVIATNTIERLPPLEAIASTPNVVKTAKTNVPVHHVKKSNELSRTKSTVKTPSATFRPYIHVMVTRDKLLANNTAKGIQFLLQVPVKLSEKNELFRVQVGPIYDAEEAKMLLANIQKQGYPEAYPLRAPK
ncbi:septal ring lytic transglycosylase RlpA family protein [Thalassotalea psychrophila]|uniref:Endolytic peptidoglycan transglycosylase RlpA n=1 Tax=Thalassotalea psychrophila TaxID=3065647 RepID=A0ABY9TR16_9GAMM|nr:septal ring lytic transglycosylase RlpA family protein [Colwelliaceae bacterium SQ149]